MDKAVGVVFGGRERVMRGIRWNTTAQDVIKSILRENNATGLRPESYTLLEEWRGCVRELKNDEKVSKVLDRWGFPLEDEQLPVRLRVVRRSHFVAEVKPTCQSDHKYRGGRVASRKRQKCKRAMSKRRYLNEFELLSQDLSRMQAEISKLTTPRKPQKLELKLPIDVSLLPPELEDECVALQEEYEEESKENADLVRRKEELTRNILSQKTDIDTLTETMSSLEARVLNEQHKLNRVIETSGPPELAEAQKEVDKLQNELKMRTKLNELQSAKLRELTTAIENIEQEISESTKKLQNV